MAYAMEAHKCDGKKSDYINVLQKVRKKKSKTMLVEVIGKNMIVRERTRDPYSQPQLVGIKA